MTTEFEPPPTWAPVVLEIVDPATGSKTGSFNPVWLKWFIDIAALITAAGGGGSGGAIGDVVGPMGAISDHLATFDGVTGKLIKDGGAIPSSGLGDVNGPASAIDGNLAVFDGATGKLIRQAYRYYYNVLDFANIQTALNSIPEWSVLFIPAGQINIGTKVTISKAVHIMGTMIGGPASVIAGTTTTMDLFEITTANAVMFSNVHLSSTATPKTAGAGIKFNSATANTYSVLDNVQFSNQFTSVDITKAAYWRISNCVFSVPPTNAKFIHIQPGMGDSGDTIIENCIFIAGVNNCISVLYDSGGGLKMNGCKFLQGGYGIKAIWTGSDASGIVIVSGCSFDGQKVLGILLETTGASSRLSWFTIVGNVFDTDGDTDPTAGFIKCVGDSAQRQTQVGSIAGNVFRLLGTTSTGIFVDIVDCLSIAVVGNTMIGPLTSTSVSLTGTTDFCLVGPNLIGPPIVNSSSSSLVLSCSTDGASHPVFGVNCVDPHLPLEVRTGTNQRFGVGSHITMGSGVTLEAYNDTRTANVPFEFRATHYFFDTYNIGLGAIAAGTNATKTFVFGWGVAPTTTPANSVQLFNSDGVSLYSLDGAGYYRTITGAGFPIDVRAYGALPSASAAVNAAALQAALTAATNLGVELYIPAGTYSCNSALTTSAVSVRIRGDGSGRTTILFTTTSGGLDFTALVAATVNNTPQTVHVEGITLTVGSGTINVTTPAIRAEWSAYFANAYNQCIIRDVIISSYVPGSVGSFSAGVRLKNCYQALLEDVMIIGGTSALSASIGVDLNACVSVKCRDVDVWGYNQAVKIDKGTQTQTEYVVLDTCTFYNVNLGVLSNQAIAISMKDSHVALNAIGVNNAYCVDFTNVSQSKIIDCLFYVDTIASTGTGQYAIRLAGTGSANHVQRNTIGSLGVTGNSTYGIRLQDTITYTNVSDNTIAGFVTRDIYIKDATCSLNHVVNNIMYSNGSADAVDDNGTGTVLANNTPAP